MSLLNKHTSRKSCSKSDVGLIWRPKLDLIFTLLQMRNFIKTELLLYSDTTYFFIDRHIPNLKYISVKNIYAHIVLIKKKVIKSARHNNSWK